MVHISTTKSEIIVVEQLPVITEQLRLIADEIDKKIAEAKALPVTDQTIKTVKAMRAALTKDFNAIEERRKAVKAAVLAPYEAFEAVYKQYVSDKYKTADNDLKVEIDRNETVRKNEKAAEVKVYFEEYAASRHIDIVPWERAGIKVGLSDSIKSLKEQAKAFIDRICDDLALIETHEHKPEILVEYKKTLNCSQAITAVKARFEAIEREKQRQAGLEEKRKAEAEAVNKVQAVVQAQKPLEPPKTIIQDAPIDPVKTLAFKVTAPISKLKELKKFLDDGEYQYE